ACQLAVSGWRFQALAKQFSEAQGAERGGLLGTFARGELDPQLEQGVFVMSPRSMSEVIRTDRAVQIVRVDKFEPPGYRTLDEAREQIRETLYQKAVDARVHDEL